MKEKLHKEQVLAILGTLGGLVLLFADKLSPGALWGNLAALVSGLAFSFVFLFTRMQKEGNPLPSLMLSHWIAAAVSLGIASFQPLPEFGAGSLGAILVLGIFQIGLAAVFFSYGVKRVSAVTGNLLAFIEPLFNPVWVLVVLGECPTGWTLAGGALILVSVAAAGFIGVRRTSQPPK